MRGYFRVDTILFAQLARNLEVQIARGEKKRIFDEGEGIQLAPTTVKDAVSFLEHLDLYTVDEDLNGRLFETFLTATMRGSALGQFFTPRSVVKFMVRLIKLRASKLSMDLVLDGCCGTGGFLIEAMANMTATVIGHRALTKPDKDKFRAPDMPFGPRRNDGVRLSLLSGAKDPKRGLQELKRRRKHLTFTPKYAEYITGRIMASRVIHGTSIPHALPSQSRGHGQRAPCRGSAGRTGHLL